MAPATYRYLALSAWDGQPQGELDLYGVEITDLLTDIGVMRATVPLESPKSYRTLTQPGLIEIAVIRKNTATGVERCVWNGPITRRQANVADGTVQLEMRDPRWWFSKRVTERIHNFTGDQFAAVRSLIADAKAKAANHPWSFTVTTGNSGINKKVSIGSTERRYVSEVIADLAEDDDTGFDHRVAWSYTAATLTVTRQLQLGYPTLGTDKSSTFTLPASFLSGFLDLDDVDEVDRAANRVHVLGGQPAKSKVIALSSYSTASSYPTLETVLDRSDITSQAQLDGMAKAARRVLNPAVKVWSVTWRPEYGRTLDDFDLGDTIRVVATKGTETINARRRVIGVTIRPQDDGAEEYEAITNNPADEVLE